MLARFKGSDAEPAFTVALGVLGRVEMAAKDLGVREGQGMADAGHVCPAGPHHEAPFFSRLAFVNPAQVMGDGRQSSAMKCGNRIAAVLMADRNTAIGKG